MLLKYLHAAISIFNTTVLGKNRVTPEQYQIRLETCMRCPAIQHKDTNNPICGGCGCYILHKALDRTETCTVDRKEWRIDNAPKI